MSVLFTHLCDVYVVEGAPGRLGSESRLLKLSIEAAPCTFVMETEKAVNTTSAELVQIETSLLLLPPRVVLAEQMVIKNIRQKDGSVIEPGPYLIEKIAAQRALGKSLHHWTAQLKLDLSLRKEQA